MPASVELRVGVATAVGILVTAGYVLCRYRSSSRVRKSVCQISQIWIYPIFSASALLVESADCTDDGLRYKKVCNRMFELVGECRYSPVNSSRIRKLQLEYDEQEESLIVRGPGMRRDLRISLVMPEYKICEIKTIRWLNEGKTLHIDEGDERCEWFSKYLGQNCRLIRVVPREVVRRFYLDLRDKALNPPKCPFNITNLASINYINARLDSPMSVGMFCGNIILANKGFSNRLHAYEEDTWRWIHLGDEVTLYNPETYDPLPNPNWGELPFTLSSLVELMKCMGGVAKVEMRKANFGVGASLVLPGRIRVGDTVIGTCVPSA